MFFMHPFPSISIPFFFSTTSITLTLIHFHSIPLFPFHFMIPIHFLYLLWLIILPRSVVLCYFINRHSYISSIAIPIPLSSILHIPFLSFLRFLSTCLYYEICNMLINPYSYGVLIGNTQSQLDVTAFVSDVWFESRSIEWSGNAIMGTWGLEGIGEPEAGRTEVDSTVW